MKKIIIAIIIPGLITLGCKEKSTIPQKPVAQLNANKDSLFSSLVEQFALPYSQNLRLDSNTLIFYGSRPFDTSFLLQLKFDSKEIMGIYSEVIPAYHTEVADFSVDENKLIFFEGYSFILKPSYWEKITDQANKFLADSIDLNTNIACNDCEIYALGYNGKRNIGNAIKYRSWYKDLKKTFLDSFIVRRNPIIHK